MNFRALLKSLLITVVLLVVAWWWWQSTTPNLPIEPAASTSPQTKLATANIFAPKSLPEQVAMAARPANVNDSIALTRTESSQAAATHVVAQQDPSLPDSAYLAVPLNQSEHHAFREGPITKDASIEGYYHDGRGREWVALYVWQYILPSGDIGPEGPSEERVPMAYYPGDQDYIHNWAKQQAAAAANAPATPQVSSEPEAPAPYVPPAPSGPVVITN